MLLWLYLSFVPFKQNVWIRNTISFVSLFCGHFKKCFYNQLLFWCFYVEGKPQTSDCHGKYINLYSIFSGRNLTNEHSKNICESITISSPLGFEENTALRRTTHQNPAIYVPVLSPLSRASWDSKVHLLKQNKISPSSSSPRMIDGQIQFLLFCIKTWTATVLRSVLATETERSESRWQILKATSPPEGLGNGRCQCPYDGCQFCWCRWSGDA